LIEEWAVTFTDDPKKTGCQSIPFFVPESCGYLNCAFFSSVSTMMSARRFLARPSRVLLSATGLFSPKPSVLMRSPLTLHYHYLVTH
jgi:hypothetical protein